MVEIERKFLVDDPAQAILSARHSFQIFQGYISNDPARTVRLRIGEGKGFLTIKGASSADGTTRLEWEQEIPLSEAKALMPLCLPGVIQKTRYHVVEQQQLFEVDVFEGSHVGLVIAEIELKNAKNKIQLPPWIGKEITGDKRYYNSYLAVHGMPS
jgi:CYTH domain-containing protein